MRNKDYHHTAIIEAATAEFMEYGFKDASMRRIANAVGMSAAGLYKHFASKEEMFSALVEPSYQGLLSLFGSEAGEQAKTFSVRLAGTADEWAAAKAEMDADENDELAIWTGNEKLLTALEAPAFVERPQQGAASD